MGTYYTEDGYLSKEEFDALETKPNPVGDVTPEEVQWVSQWFRTHRNPDPETVYWKDYFIQDISADFDRTFETFGDSASCDKGTRIMEAPLYVFSGSGEPQFTYSTEPEDITPNLEAWGWVDYNTSRTIYGKMEKLVIGITDNRFQYDTWNPDILFDEQRWSGWEHIYDFNSGTGTNDFKEHDRVVDDNGNYIVPNSELAYRTIQLYEQSGTADFSYQNTDGPQRFHKYVLKHLVFDIPQTAEKCEIHKIKCTNHHYDGYYLGFDYEICLTGTDVDKTGDGTSSSVKRKKLGDNGQSEDENGESGNTQQDESKKLCYKPRDGFFNNWILKISHASDVQGNNPSEYPKNYPLEQGLLVCEDLGATDYDFNDVVLKLQHVKYKHDENAAETDRLRITAMAAGGAMPSKIYFKDGTGSNAEFIEVKPENDESNEIHNLLYGKAPTIINAAPDFRGEGKTWSYEIDFDKFDGYPGENDEYKDKFASYAFDNKLIQIAVNNGSTTEPTIIGGGDGDIREKGTVPQMMFLPIDYLWPQEERPIDEAYKQFPSWVGNSSNTEWYKSPETPNETYVTMRYVNTSSGTTTVREPKLTVVRRDNNETIENNGRIDLNVGDVIRIRCKSPNTEVIKCLVGGQAGTETSAGVTWEVNGIKITWKEGEGLLTIEVTEKAAGQQCQIEFSQEDQDQSHNIDKRSDKVAFTVYVNNSGGGGSGDGLEGFSEVNINSNDGECTLNWGNMNAADYGNGATLKILFDNAPTESFEIRILDGNENQMDAYTVATKEIDVDLSENDIFTWRDRGQKLVIKYTSDSSKITGVYIKPKASSTKRRISRR